MAADPKFIAKVRLTSQGQITLPQEAREDLCIDCGSDLYWYELNDSLIVTKELLNQKDLLTAILSKIKKKK